VEHDEATAVVSLRRTATASPTVEPLRSPALEAERTVAALPSRRGIPVDAREAPPRNDAASGEEFDGEQAALDDLAGTEGTAR
jgi:hypothetical protein